MCICTYNGGGRLRGVVDALRIQTQPAHTWELIIVDNASTDDTGKVAADLIRGLFGGRARVVHEAKAGLSFARARAGREAQGEIICFLDDDNIPSPGFVAAAIQAFAQCPKAGAVGGKVLPLWEAAPSPLALAIQDFALAIADRGDNAFKYDNLVGPVGAGLCIKAELLRRIYQHESVAGKVVGRKTSGFGGGEDVAIGVLVWRMGFECWYDPSLVIQHALPARRMEKDYLLRLYNGIGRGQAAVRRLHDWKARTPLAWLVASKDLARWTRGCLGGASTQMCQQYAGLADDVHDLHQTMVLGRAAQTFRFW